MVIRNVRCYDLYYSYYLLMIYQTYNILDVLHFLQMIQLLPSLIQIFRDLDNIINDTLFCIHELICNNRLHLIIEKK